MRTRMIVAIGLVMMAGALTACGLVKKEAKATEYVTYEFETYDGNKVVIDSTNIVSQEKDENPLESSIVPADAEVIAPGRDYVYLSDSTYYYVEDATNNLVTVANQYPQIAYIDDVLYYKTNEVCEMVPRKAPDGIIDTFVEKEIMPDSPNSANFGAEEGKLEYIILEDSRLIIHVGENWYYTDTKK